MPFQFFAKFGSGLFRSGGNLRVCGLIISIRLALLRGKRGEFRLVVKVGNRSFTLIIDLGKSLHKSALFGDPRLKRQFRIADTLRCLG